ncbi:hypothetical protein OPKNFCMD_2324 [Methylobacterium crusticola]|uniref:Uncharacterized protein n=1 Tax=Methylobacterium crusticola TaxID=1697972 RepID=A0ABQ4QWL9_9HYPH|nr:hypothetical protein [Methylobacterium crusticola]GJD49592.1 hypothetical protein OPKNFCMD_2324 [Methylobacterium crusticola]
MKVRGLASLPEFASDADIAVALVGKQRAPAAEALFATLEASGFPHVDPRFNARYVPAVRRFFEVEYGLAAPLDPPSGDGEVPALRVRARRRD